MPLEVDWSKCNAFHNPITVEKDHPLYEAVDVQYNEDIIKDQINHHELFYDDGFHDWHKMEDKFITQDPRMKKIGFKTLTIGLCEVKEYNIEEWLFRLSYGWFSRLYYKSDLSISYWTNSGWNTRAISRQDLVDVIGLRANTAIWNREEWMINLMRSNERKALSTIGSY